MNRKAWFNIHAQGAGRGGLSYQQMVDYHAEFQPAWSLIMDGYGLIKDCRKVSRETNYIQRSYKPDGWWLKYPADHVLAQIDKELGDDYDTWWYVENEVGLQAQYFIKLIEANAKRDRPRRIVVVNASVGTPDVDEWRTHDGQKLLRLIAKYKEWCVLDLHEYFLALIATGFQDQHIIPNPADWPTHLDQAKNNWLCGRFWWVIKLCVELGIQVRFVIAEFGPDAISNLEKTVGKLDGGWLNAIPWWRQYLPDLTDEECIYMMMHYMITVICENSWVEGVLWYCMWHIDPKWLNYDISPLYDRLMKLIREWRVPKRLPQLASPAPTPEPVPEEPVPQPPQYVPKPDNATLAIEVYALKPRNLRSGPGTDYNDDGDVKQGDRIRWYTSPIIERDGLRWSWVEVLEGVDAGKAGYMSVTDFKWQSNNPNPPTVPAPQQPVERVIQLVITATDEEATQIADALMRLFGSIANLGTVLKPIQTRTMVIDQRKETV